MGSQNQNAGMKSGTVGTSYCFGNYQWCGSRSLLDLMATVPIARLPSHYWPDRKAEYDPLLTYNGFWALDRFETSPKDILKRPKRPFGNVQTRVYGCGPKKLAATNGPGISTESPVTPNPLQMGPTRASDCCSAKAPVSTWCTSCQIPPEHRISDSLVLPRNSITEKYRLQKRRLCTGKFISRL
jgi:hypothetical protein